jgi:spore coat polysaccharide biosynthesis protein SpsF
MGKVGLIIQCRLSSTRLPGKAMLDMFERPMIYRIIERVTRCKLVDLIILALPDKNESQLIVDAVKTLDVKIFLGDENNLVKRYIDCAEAYDISQIIRLPADNVMPDPDLIDKLITWHMKNNLHGFSSNLSSVLNNQMLDGAGAEIFPAFSLKQAAKLDPSPEQLEHVHLNFYDYKTKKICDNKKFPVAAPPVEELLAHPEIVLDVNTLNDYVTMNALFCSLYKASSTFDIYDVVKKLGY